MARSARWRSNCAVSADRSFRHAAADRDLAGHAGRGQGDRHRADQSDRRRGDPLSPGAAGESRRRRRPAARACRQGDAGAGRAGGAAEGRQSARRHHAHRAWAATICARSGSPASRASSAAALRKSWKMPARARWRRKASTRSQALLGNDFRRRLKPLAESRWAHDPVRARLLFPRAARPRRQARRARRPGRRPAVLCRRGHLAEFFLHRARRARFGRAGGGGGDGGARRDSATRHCEKRSDEAIQSLLAALDCFASLAMTKRRLTPSPSPSSPHPAQSTPHTSRKSGSGCARPDCRPHRAAASARRTRRASTAIPANSTAPSARRRI